jgi:DNA-binding NarL/FixJ family response regulator
MAELRLLIADDHELIRRGLRDLLGTRIGWQVVGEACNGLEAVEMAVRLKPNIVILDFFMPQMNGPEAATQIAETMPEVGVVVLTMDDSEQVIREVLQAGVRGLVLKSDADRDLLEAVQSVAQNRHFFGARVAERVLGGYLSGGQEPAMNIKKTATRLTDREREVMRLLAEGMTSREAAVQLKISIRTVESHRINISRKLSLSSIADLVRYAIRTGIVAQA